MLAQFFPCILVYFFLRFLRYLVSTECSNSFFDCGNGKCIANFFTCDDDNDCGGWEDEMNCSDTVIIGNFHHIPSNFERNCPSDHFSCGDDFGTCIPLTWVCDGRAECINKMDESNCTAENVDCGSDFMCDNFECLPQMWRCDGVYDCMDNSDEKNCNETHSTQLKCDKEHGMFQCSSGECIGYSRVCDNTTDCHSGDDEGLICHLKKCNDKKCSHLCMVDEVTNATRCYCPPGYTIMNETICTDFDECEDNKITNFCSQKCINHVGSYSCDCYDGYELINSSCHVKGESPILYYSTGNEIRAMNIRNKEYYPVVETKSSSIIIGMDTWISKQKLFYAGSTFQSHGSVSEISLNTQTTLQNEIEVLYREQLKGIEGIAIDWLAEHFYFTESDGHKILVCNIDSLVCITLHKDRYSPRGILVRPLNGELYWTEWGNHSGIYRSEMDGSNLSLLIDKILWPNNLAMDELANRLYWCDGQEGKIEYFDFETKFRHMVYHDAKRQPYSLFVFEENLYWSDWFAFELISINKISGHNMTVLAQNSNNRIYGVTVAHSSMQKSSRTIYNPCEAHICSHLCLLRSNATSYTCACPDHMVLSNDKHTCIEINLDSFLLVNTGHKVFKFYTNSVNDMHAEEVPLLPIYSIAHIAFNYERQELFVYDLHRNRIGVLRLKMPPTMGQWRTLVNDGLNSVMDLTFDPNTNLIYWVDMNMGTLETAGTVMLGQRAILNNRLVKPISLAINAPLRKIYVGLRTSPSQIIELTMDGKSKHSLLASGFGLPLVMTMDGANRLYWGDPVLQQIDSVDVTKQRIRDIRSGLISTEVGIINSLAINNGTIYWTNIESNSFFYSKRDNLTIKPIVQHQALTESIPNMDHLKVIVAKKQAPIYDFCLGTKNPCHHLCLIGIDGPVCKCFKGYTSTNNGRNCTKVSYSIVNSSTKTKNPHTYVTVLEDPSQIFQMITNVWRQRYNDGHASNSESQWIVSTETPTEPENINDIQIQAATSANDQSSTISNIFYFIWKCIILTFIVVILIFIYFM